MHSYAVKVHEGNRAPNSNATTLWGGGDLDMNVAFDLILTIRVDDFGETIAIYSEDGLSPAKLYGQLHKGQIYSFNLRNIRHVFANCIRANLDTLVTCTLIYPTSPNT